ncbi:hypothetical protein [Actinoplanes sp. NBRC 101535]|uniref:hypothetical protein n=1 Tax=Actinoplanes sp. NBRC 101535 TaxID=3032196 RepID=UPI0024A5A61B|nr:hypothetical protein [Actinoplanes sp. NBRC 101535]GLY08266.1 hypothetical protein Acsp01_86450 [Actinoplanes sp. NBRC 101535]
MTAAREYWIGSVFVVEWDITDLDGTPVPDATVAGIVATPSGGTAPMVLAHETGTGTYRLSYQAAASGQHGWRVQSSGTADGVIAGKFVVSPDVTGAPPITTDLSSDVGRIRLLTTDTDVAFPLHTDAELLAFLALEGGNLKRAAAAQLESIATSETLVAKKISTQDLSTDGPAVSADLRTRAKALREQADREDPAGADIDDGFGFDFVDLGPRAWYGGGY